MLRIILPNLENHDGVGPACITGQIFLNFSTRFMGLTTTTLDCKLWVAVIIFQAEDVVFSKCRIEFGDGRPSMVAKSRRRLLMSSFDLLVLGSFVDTTKARGIWESTSLGLTSHKSPGNG